MDNLGHIEIRISGSKGNLDLTPDNYDIRELISLLENAEDLLFSGDKKERPNISYSVESGSVKHVFKTSMQYVIGFNALIGQIAKSNHIHFLALPTATAFENIQKTAVKRNYKFSIKTSLSNSHEIQIDKSTTLYKKEALWADAEFYFYGKITNAGGKEKANIRVFTEELGTVSIQTPIRFLEQYNENLLYKSFGLRASGKQHLETGEIDTSSLIFIELIDYHPKYDPNYLKSLRDKAKNTWLGSIQPEQWLNEVRDGYEA